MNQHKRQTERLVVTSPYKQRPVCELEYDSRQSLRDKVAQSRAAQLEWKKLPLAERMRMVEAGLEKLQQRGDSITRDVTVQMGKPLAQSRAELNTLRERTRTCLALATSALAADELPPLDGIVRRIEHEPLGVILNIAAWNYPLIIPINVIVPALLAGNTIVLKHSGRTPLTGGALEDAFGRLEIPHLVTNVILSHEQTSELIDSGGINHVAFTGSVGGGRGVYQSAARQLLTAGMELGGNDPAYVAADADLDFAVANIVDGACYNAGQSCCAVERVYVHRDLYNAFLDKARAAIDDYRMGDPLADDTTMGPLATREALSTLELHVSDAVARGAKLLAGGQSAESLGGNFFSPTLLADCLQESLVMQEESFGPLLPVSLVSDDEAAIRLMNDSRFGLTASVWTTDADRAEKLSRELEAGTIT